MQVQAFAARVRAAEAGLTQREMSLAEQQADMLLRERIAGGNAANHASVSFEDVTLNSPRRRESAAAVIAAAAIADVVAPSSTRKGGEKAAAPVPSVRNTCPGA